MKKRYVVLASVLVLIVVSLALIVQLQTSNTNDSNSLSRKDAIPAGAIVITPENDSNPPKSLSDEYYDPVPVMGPINTAGAEDSPFIIANGSTLYFFFTPNMSVPVEKQVLDPTVGIWVSHKVSGVWTEPERVMLQDKGKLALDGGEVVQGNKMYFCSAREGYTGINWFKAEFIDGKWQNWANANDFLKYTQYQVGELYITSDANELYFHSTRTDGAGSLDIWVCKNINGEWATPENILAVNSPSDEGWPTLSPDGNELWFSRDYAIWRSIKVNGEWQTPEKMFSPLAGEPSVDENGNVYFVHHFLVDGTIVSADIYVAYKK